MYRKRFFMQQTKFILFRSLKILDVKQENRAGSKTDRSKFYQSRNRIHKKITKPLWVLAVTAVRSGKVRFFIFEI
jgi:hypothetical protein